jgi:hypothetical protein
MTAKCPQWVESGHYEDYPDVACWGDEMDWLIGPAVQAVSDLFGFAAGHKRPWWVEVVATLGCFIFLGIPVLIIWVLLR